LNHEGHEEHEEGQVRNLSQGEPFNLVCTR
jgi:hypothetical protein